MGKLQPLKFRILSALVVLFTAIGTVHAADGEKATADSDVTKLVEAQDAKIPKQSETAEYDLRHIVKDGENLWVLAELFTGDGNNWKELAEVNELNESGKVVPGQTIHIPASLSKATIDVAALEDDESRAVKVKAEKAEKAEVENRSKSNTIPADVAKDTTVYFYDESKAKVTE